MPKALSTEEFIQRAVSIHGQKYIYDKVSYKTGNVPLCIICKIHGEFHQKPSEHLSGCGCPICGRKTANAKISANKDRAANISKAKLAASSTTKQVTQERKKATLLDKYGVDNAARLTTFKDKIRQANNTEIMPGVTKKQLAQEKAKSTMLLRYGVDNIFKLNEYIQEKFYSKYGVNNPGQVPEISQRSLSNSRKSKIYTMPSGKEIQVQGFEGVAIKWLLDLGVSEDNIITDRKLTPKIWYTGLDNKRHRYYPDILIQDQNQIYEVKGLYTYYANLDKNNLKKEACIAAGFSFQFLICDKKGVIDVR